MRGSRKLETRTRERERAPERIEMYGEGFGLIVLGGLRCGCLLGDTLTFKRVCITCQCFRLPFFRGGFGDQEVKEC